MTMTHAQRRKLSEYQDLHCKRYNRSSKPATRAYQAYILAHLASLHALENCLFNAPALEIHLAVAERYRAESDKVEFSDTELESLYQSCADYDVELLSQP